MKIELVVTLIVLAGCAKADEVKCRQQPRADQNFAEDGTDISYWKSRAVRKDVAIIGGGVAGLTALRTLNKLGNLDIILIEAQSKLGGRVQTIRKGSIVLEDGAQWIHGGPKNPIYKIASEVNAIEIDQYAEWDNSDPLIVREDGSQHAEDSELLQKVYSIIEDDAIQGNELQPYYGLDFGSYCRDRFKNEISRGSNSSIYNSWLHVMEQLLNSHIGSASWNDIAARSIDQFTDLGHDFTWKNGYDTVLYYLKSGIRRKQYVLNQPVSRILWELDKDDPAGALIITNSSSFLVDRVIVAVPVGFLKYNPSLFSPKLDASLQFYFQGTEPGSANKIFMGWPKSWWGNESIPFVVLWTSFDLSPEMDWLYGIVMLYEGIRAEPFLLAFVTGEYSRKMEQLYDDVVKQHFLFFLRKIVPGTEIPEPSFFRRTRWIANPWSYGSYGSFINTDSDRAGLHSRAAVQKPLVNKWNRTVVYWAGEHTHETRYSTVDGAFSSGEKAAQRLMKEYRPNKEVETTRRKMTTLK